MEQRKVTCRGCQCAVTLANVVLLTDSRVVYECGCADIQQVTMPLSSELFAAIVGPAFPLLRLPYSAAPNRPLPLDPPTESTIRQLRFVLDTIATADEFLSWCDTANRFRNNTDDNAAS